MISSSCKYIQPHQRLAVQGVVVWQLERQTVNLIHTILSMSFGRDADAVVYVMSVYARGSKKIHHRGQMCNLLSAPSMPGGEV